ncbi:MAG: sulfotransferase [Alphaproteobacteria bacterium]
MSADTQSATSENAPLFIVGCGRSGTTLLRLMLSAHSALAIPEESHFIYQLARKRAAGFYRGGLEHPACWERLLQFFHNHEFINRWRIDMSMLMHRLHALPDRNYRDVFETVFDSYREREGKSIWGDKTPMHANYMLLVRHFFPNARFIHIVRDGREVALSLMTRKWGPRHISHAGYYWKWLVLAGMSGGHAIGPDNYRQIRFEDLVRDPHSVLQALCHWLQLEFEPAILDYHKTIAAQDYAAHGEKARQLGQPLDTSKLDRWKTAMSVTYQESVLKQAGGLLAHLGYEAPAINRSQQVDRARIEELLRQPPTSLLPTSSQPMVHGQTAEIRLLGMRARQALQFARGDYTAWTTTGMRWQQSVASLMH